MPTFFEPYFQRGSIIVDHCVFLFSRTFDSYFIPMFLNSDNLLIQPNNSLYLILCLDFCCLLIAEVTDGTQEMLSTDLSSG